MCILLTPLPYFITTVIIEVYLQCFTESVSLRDIGKPTSRAETSSPSSLYLKAVKGAHIGSALISWGDYIRNSNFSVLNIITPFLNPELVSPSYFHQILSDFFISKTVYVKNNFASNVF